ncbi:YbaY family lipoprotein [Paludibacterium paludis]|uniref:Lipoprotein n=1 Tax=Paludibacterium paludis TaxID=1225769 RepID=A0A918NXN1_9NEIS|nr:YbaY family lipoprotein [Paludibacterium paludis]GGY03423.1 hypothetical protein GCM10011289_02150 [Paludibacterium paludis]
MRRGAFALIGGWLLPIVCHAWEPAALDGSVVLPAGAEVAGVGSVHVRLLDVSRADAPASLLAESIIEHPKSAPVAFSLVYDKAAAKPGGSYQIVAEVFGGGQLRLMKQESVDPASGAHPELRVERFGAGRSAP